MSAEKDTALINAIADMRGDEALGLVQTLLDEGTPARRILDLARAALEIIGQRFERGEYFLPELMMAGEMMEQIAALVRPLLAQGAGAGGDAKKPPVLIGTVRGDVHDIGKNIVTFMLEANGFRVVDLGVDVPIQTFVDKVREVQPAVIGLSGFLTLAFDAMRETIKALNDAGLRQGRKIMIGGGQVDESICTYTGADAFGTTAMVAVNLCKQWLG